MKPIIHVPHEGGKVKLSITATRTGLAIAQKQAFVDLLFALDEPLIEFHHGDCIGGDDEADAIVGRLYPDTLIFIHPAEGMESKRAYCAQRGANRTVLPARPPIERNHHMVDATDLLIAMPSGFNEVLRSGTWATIRYARLIDRHSCTIYPDGSDEWRGGKEIALDKLS